MQEEPKDFKVVEGDGSELEISPVYDHINSLQQARKQKKETIIIPTANNKATKNKVNTDKDDSDNMLITDANRDMQRKSTNIQQENTEKCKKQEEEEQEKEELKEKKNKNN